MSFKSPTLGLLAVALIELVSAANLPPACKSLQTKFPGVTFLPQSTDYATQIALVWSETCLTTPYCVFEPTTADDLAAGLSILTSSKTSFAVRSGGHMPVPDANGINNGVLISMSGLNQNKMINNNAIVQVGPGQTWNDVYTYASTFNKGVAGGRFSPVGVGGLLLGGGLPYFASQVGWACSTVKAYQVVLADSTIVEATATHNSDLFWALKGGSNNFGIVTRFDMETLDVTELYGGDTLYNTASYPAFLNAITEYVSPGGGSEDVKAAILPNIVVTPSTGLVEGSLVAFYNGDNAAPQALAGFNAVANNFTDDTLYSFLSYTNLTNIPAFAARNFRWLFATTAIKVSKDTVALLDKLYTQPVIQALQNVTGCGTTLALQPITKAQLQAAKDAGGDAIDLDPSMGTFISVLINIDWENAADDATVNQFARKFISKVDAAAKEAGLHIPFTYLNDAQSGQEVFQYYGGGSSLPILKRIQRKYDPKGIFQRLENSGFKLPN